MKQLIFLFCLFSSTIASSQEIENINFFLEGKNIVITYDFINCSNSDLYDISVVLVEQNQSRITPISLSGDLKKVSCGSKRIVWNLLNDREELSGKYQVWLDFKVASKNPLDIEWVQIPAGTFMMGSKENEEPRKYDETLHKVVLSAFKMSKNEITFDQYDVFCEKTGREKPTDIGWGRGNRPVMLVNWEDAVAFARWIGGRLPTEAEWEYACRAGTTTPFNTGNNLNLDQANFNKEKGQTLPVGSYPSNSWGLNDMHGNVAEWCSDFFNKKPRLSKINPKGPKKGCLYVYRGGGYNSPSWGCRSARCDYGAKDFNLLSIGFRIVEDK